MRLVRDACKRGVAGVIVTHDAQLASWADRVVFLRDGRMVDHSSPAPARVAADAGRRRDEPDRHRRPPAARRAVVRWAYAPGPAATGVSTLVIVVAAHGRRRRRRGPHLRGVQRRATLGPRRVRRRQPLLPLRAPGSGDPPTKLDAAKEWFGTIDPIGHLSVPVPGSVDAGRLPDPGSERALRSPPAPLRDGRYPTSDGEVAVSDGVAVDAGATIGSTIDLDGVERTVVGKVENPSDLGDEFVLLPPSALGAVRRDRHDREVERLAVSIRSARPVRPGGSSPRGEACPRAWSRR